MLAILLAVALPARAEPVDVHADPLDRAWYEGTVTASPGLAFVAGWRLSAADRRFGGLSGVEVSGDGGTVTAVTDAGTWLTLTLSPDHGIDAAGMVPLRDGNGAPLAGKALGDAEGLADTPGGYAVSFERRHRVAVYPSPDGAAANAEEPPAPLPANKGLEALARLPDGQLLALAEAVDAEGWAAGWLIGPDGWSALRYRPGSLTKPVGADLCGDGGSETVLVLERGSSLLAGLTHRIAAIPVDALEPGADIVPRRLAALSLNLEPTNFEGLACRTNEAGETLIYLVSDDNFRPGLLQTLLLVLKLDVP